MVDLPNEIWLLIAQELHDDLGKIKSLNSLFFNCWMDHKWNKVHVSLTETDEGIRLLGRIEDPFVAAKVKALSVTLNMYSIAARRDHGWPTIQSVETMQTALLRALAIMPRITYLHVLLSHNLPDKETFLVSFFQTITSSPIATTLRKLSMSGTIGTFPLIAPWLAQYSAHNNTPFKNLSELLLMQFDSFYDRPPTWPIYASTPVESSPTLAPFIRSLAPTLQMLQIMDGEPQPANLSISVALFKVARSGHPVTFPGLKCLRLWLRNSEDKFDPRLPELVGNGPRFPSLQILDIKSCPASPSGISTLLALIKLSASTLFDLTITNCRLTDMQAKQVLTEVRALKRLLLTMSQLSVAFLDFLAHKFPHLEHLSLHVAEIVGTDQASFEDLLADRRYDPTVNSSTKDILHSWKLRHLKIGNFYGRDEDQFMKAKCAVAGAVPSVVL